ncbi:urease accessory protein UreE [Ancylobacter terrae]|uniref:urease accessory protein UreE n=1 Tax=Ancylobacter sp. sgz301288 TaxID=3342077 RepID=UPI003858D0B8
MIRARTILPAGTWDQASAADRIVLPHDGRYRRRIAMRGEGDVAFLLDLVEATRIKDGDGLKLDDGRIVAVAAAEEPVAEITARDSHHLARLAWHLGNRHVPAEFLADRIRIARDPVLEEMVRGLGGVVAAVEAPFEPEGGAYEAAEAHGHHDHAHGEHHHHDAACGCGHDHGHDHEHHGHHDHGHHDHGHHDHGHHHEHGHAHDHEHHYDHHHDHGHHEHHERDVMKVGSPEAGSAHEHGDACGCGHDHHGHGHHDPKHQGHGHDDHHGHDHHHHDHGRHGSHRHD